MTLITRFPTAPSTSSGLPALAWNSGLSPNRRWLGADLPADGATLGGADWASQYGDLRFPPLDATKPLTVGAEAGIRYAVSPGTGGFGLTIPITDPSTMRTVVVIARPNTGDVITGVGRLFRFGDTGAVAQQSSDSATVDSGVASVAAVRGKWHLYAVSLPTVGTVGGNAVFVVDGNSTTMPYSDATWNASALRIAGTSVSNGRQWRILEILTSASTFTASELTALYPKAVAWYPGLNW
jgi:hypothetical protein